MPDYYAVTSDPLPKALHMGGEDFSIRTLSESERIAVEDYLLSKGGTKTALKPETTAVIVSHSSMVGATIEDVPILIEFALGILATTGFQPIAMIATFGTSDCREARLMNQSFLREAPTFPKKLGSAAVSAWVRRFLDARHNTKDRLHITADRFVRYCKTKGSRDSLVDLCICLESLLDATTEISFRFGACLAKATGATGRKAEEACELLSALYDLRSRVVHGADSNKEYNKINAHLGRLHRVSREILTGYVLYLSEHKRDDWTKHLRRLLLG